MSKSNGPRKHPSPGSDYEVGYCRPPAGTQFKVGNPGNPRSRRRKPETIDQILDRAMLQRITIDQNGRSRTMAMQELIIFNLARASAKVNLPAIRTLFALRDRYRGSMETVLDAAEFEAEDRKIIEDFLTSARPEAPKSESDQSTDPESQNNRNPSASSEDDAS